MNRCVAKSHILFNSRTTKTLDDFNLIMVFISNDFVKVLELLHLNKYLMVNFLKRAYWKPFCYNFFHDANSFNFMHK